MMEINERLSEIGWKLSPEGYNVVTDEGKITNLSEIERKALDLDLRELGGCAFPPDLNKGKYENVSGNMVVQIQKVRNISAPKSNEESQVAPRMFKMILTDGSQSCPALELSPIKQISFNTPPGTKLLLKGEIAYSHGLLLLNTENVEVLGGEVIALFEKWLTNKDLAKQARGRVGAEGGPPPWIPFGKKLSLTNQIVDKNFKSLDDGSNTKENEEFEAQRSTAIAEARAASGAKKVFGGGTKPLLDRNIQLIMSKGFTIQEAEAALKQNKNNADKALKSLQRKSGKGGGDEKERGGSGGEGREPGGGGGSGGREGGRERGGGGRRKGGEEESGPKPTGKVSLFQFLEDKLPSLPEKEKPKEKEKEKEWEGGRQEFPPKGKGGYPVQQERSRQRSERGGGGSSAALVQNHFIGDNGVEKKNNREERQPRWQGQNQRIFHDQKPPRFQNQNKRMEANSEMFDHFMTYESQPNRQADNYFGNKGSTNQYNGFRNNYKMDSLGYNMNSPPDYRNQNSNFFKPAGMPDIPEFPYKDSAFIPPLLPPSMHSENYDPARLENQFRNFKIGDRSHGNDIHKSDQHYGAMNGSKSGPSYNNLKKSDDGSGKYRWKVGDKCMAKYWEDNVYYNAEVTGVSKRTCVVRFLEYGNFEEVLQDDCIPISEEPIESINLQSNDHSGNNYRNIHFSGSIEFRRGGSRPYIKSDGGGGGASGGGGQGGGGQTGGGGRRPRYSQPMYVPPASRGGQSK